MRREGSRDLAHLHPVKKDNFGVGLPKCLSCGRFLSVVLTDKKNLRMTVMYPGQWTREDSQNKTVKSPSVFLFFCPQKIVHYLCSHILCANASKASKILAREFLIKGNV